MAARIANRPDYTHQIAGEVTVEGDPCYRLIASPKPNAPVVWGKPLLLIRKADYLPRREEFYDGRGALAKTLSFDDIRRTGAQLPQALAHGFTS